MEETDRRVQTYLFEDVQHFGHLCEDEHAVAAAMQPPQQHV
jgi:hypothetical protein